MDYRRAFRPTLECKGHERQRPRPQQLQMAVGVVHSEKAERVDESGGKSSDAIASDAIGSACIARAFKKNAVNQTSQYASTGLPVKAYVGIANNAMPT